MTPYAPEAAARFVEPGGDPTHEHPAVPPPADVADEAADEAVEILDRIRAAQRAVERAGDVEPLQRQGLVEPFAERSGRARMCPLEAGGELREPALRQRRIRQPVGFVERAADPGSQRLGQMLEDVARLVAPLNESEPAARLPDRLAQSRPAVDDEERRPIEVET